MKTYGSGEFNTIKVESLSPGELISVGSDRSLISLPVDSVKPSNRPLVKVIYNSSKASNVGNLYIPWNLKEEDASNSFNLATGVFTSPTQGFYLIIFNIWFNKTSMTNSSVFNAIEVRDTNNTNSITYKLDEGSHTKGILRGTSILNLPSSYTLRAYFSNTTISSNYTIGENSNSTNLTIVRLII